MGKPGFLKNHYESCGLSTVLYKQQDLKLFYTKGENFDFRGELFDII